SAAHALSGFVSAVRERDFETVRGLLSEELRTRYDVRTLVADYESAGEKVEQDLREIEEALEAGGLVVDEEEGEARLPLGGGRAVHLVRETEGWRVASFQ
ncbi:MAG: hypothetical protein ACOC0J_01015, partial [Myxococcota bacterium]